MRGHRWERWVFLTHAYHVPLFQPFFLLYTSTLQIGVNGEGAVGARVEVWWQGDQCFYSGILALYDAVSTE